MGQSFNSVKPSIMLEDLDPGAYELGLMTNRYPPISFKPVYPAFRNLQKFIKRAIAFSEYKIFCVGSKELFLDLDLTKRLKVFEQEIYYSYGNKCFKIEHGKDSAKGYCGFFNTLSESKTVHFYIAQHKKNKKIVRGEEKALFRKKGEIAAVVCCALRTLKTRNGNPIKAWYICDLKVGENYRGEHLATALIKKGA